METTRRLIILSKGVCLLCSEQIAPAKSLHETEKSTSLTFISHSIQILSEYLELDIGSVLRSGKASIPEWLLNQMKTARLEVELCGNCVNLNEQFLGIIRQLETNEVEVKSCLKLIQWKLLDARKNDTTDHGDVKGYDASFIVSAGSKFKMKLGILEILRWEAIQKCSRKLDIGSPRIKLQKLSLKEVNEITLNLKSQNLPEVANPTPNDNDLDDNDDNVSDNQLCNDGANKDFLDDDFSWLSDGDDGGPNDDDDDDYLPDNESLRRSTNQGKNKRVKVSHDKQEVKNRKQIGGASNLNTDVDFSKPIMILGSKSNSTEHSKKSFKKCIFIPETGKYKCSICPKESIKATHIMSHFRNSHLQTRVKCPDLQCGKIFCYRKGYNRHVQFDHQGIRYECPYCKNMVHQGMLYLHRKKYDEMGVCPVMRSRKNGGKKRPAPADDNDDYAPETDVDGFCDNDQLGHDNTEKQLSGDKENNNAPQPSTPIPSTLKEEFKNISSTNQTQNKPTNVIVNGTANRNQTGGASNPNKNVKYSKPIITYVSKSKSAEHAKTSFKKWILIPETGKYKCRICPAECNSAFEVFIHFKSVHLQIRYKCPDAECGKLFSSRESYKHHAILEIRYECPFCKEKLKRGNLYWHKKKNEEGGICPTKIQK